MGIRRFIDETVKLGAGFAGADGGHVGLPVSGLKSTLMRTYVNRVDQEWCRLCADCGCPDSQYPPVLTVFRLCWAVLEV
jgi:hypothetical protein